MAALLITGKLEIVQRPSSRELNKHTCVQSNNGATEWSKEETPLAKS